MDNKTRLFGRQTKQVWVDLREKIIANPNDKKLWEQVTNLLQDRLETRYFRPIDSILFMRITSGEGFAVMTLLCSLIEFLQSCYEGKSFDYKLIRSADTKFGYGKSNEKFKAFLEQHQPFKTIFTKQVSKPNKHIKTFADDFYYNVRCGLFHEAATNNNWTIKTHKGINVFTQFVDISEESNKIIYRDKFVEAIKTYCDSYKKQIINNKQDNNKQYLRDNICRKLDSLCQINDKSAKWWSI
jgi:hypothetical protein